MKFVFFAVVIIVAVVVAVMALRALDRAIQQHRHKRRLREAKWLPETVHILGYDLVRVMKYGEPEGVEVGRIKKSDFNGYAEWEDALRELEVQADEEALTRNIRDEQERQLQLAR